MMLSLLGIVASLTGCATTQLAVVDSQSDIVILGSDVTGHVYFYQNGQWVLSENKIKLPAGWFAGAMKVK